MCDMMKRQYFHQRRYSMPVCLPNKQAILASLPHNSQHLDIHIYDTIDSTNLEARRMIVEGSILSPSLLISHTQTNGRGQLGRNFYSPVGSGLYLSLVFKPHTPPQNSPHITPAAALATAKAIETWTGVCPLIKWVNDLYLDGKKVCGILTEVATAPSGDVYIIVGIGVNITTKKFPQGLRHPAGCILTPDMVDNKSYDLSLLVANMVAEFWGFLNHPTACLQGYRDLFLLTGKTVTYAYTCSPDGQDHPPTPTVKGVVMGVNDTYRLLLHTDDGGVLVLGSGEVTSVTD